MAAAVQTSSTGLQYSGNPDFRGYLAAVDPSLLGFVGQGNTGNDYTSFGINPSAEAAYAKSSGQNSQTIGEQVQQLFDTYSGLVGGGGGGGGGGGSGSSSSSSNSFANPAAASLYGNLANEYNQEVSTLEGEEPTLEGNINNAYNTSVSEQNQAEGNEQNQNNQQRQSTFGSIDSNANSTYNSLMALLGASGAAVSSAARFGVPQAVGVDTNKDTNTADSTYAENQNTIQESNANALNDLLSQKNTNMANALSGLKGQEQQDVQEAQGDEANAAYYGGAPNATLTQGLNTEASNIQGQLSQIFSQYATPTFTAAAAPSLASFTAPTAPTIAPASTSTPSSSSSSAFLPFLTQSGQNNNILTGNNTAPAPAGG